MQIKKARVVGDMVLSVEFVDNTCSRFHAVWLYDNADTQNANSNSGQKQIKTHELPLTATIENVDVAGDSLKLRLNGFDTQWTFAGDWLYQHRYDQDKKYPLVEEHVTLWDGTGDLSESCYDYSALFNDSRTLLAMLDTIYKKGVAKVEKAPIKNKALLDLANLFSFVRRTNYGEYFDVRMEINPANLAFTGLGLQGHTDNPYRDPCPTMQILYCLDNSAVGGESTIVDGFHLAKKLHDEYPDEFDLLSRYCVDFVFKEKGKANLRARAAIIRLDNNRQITQIRFNNRSIAPLTHVPFEQMPDFYRALQRLSEMVDDKANQINFKLEQGEAFIVDNRRVLHGRSAYDVQSGGARWLQGCYPDIDGALSTYRLLKEKHAIPAK